MDTVRTEPGLRERKKLRTRIALVDAGLKLFYAKGYEATTVEEIAAEVEISPRTFFRYFGGKEDVAFAQLVQLDELLVEALTARPPHEAPVTALRQAHRSMVDFLAGTEDGPARFRATYELIDRTPSLVAGSLRRSAETEQRLAAVIAQRQGVDQDTDLRPRLLVRVVLASARVGVEEACRRGYANQAEFDEIINHALDLGTAGLPRKWSQTPGAW